jgi:hypothetical protein
MPVEDNGTDCKEADDREVKLSAYDETRRSVTVYGTNGRL